MLDKILRFIIIVLAVIVGLMLTDRVIPLLAPWVSEEFFSVGIFGITVATIFSFAVGGIIGGFIGFIISPFLLSNLWQFTYWVEARLNRMPVNDVLAGAIGLSIGLIISNLLYPYYSQYYPWVSGAEYGDSQARGIIFSVCLDSLAE